ncbi:MAG: hypothetical protein HUU50_22900, partial [Candidatus Brocadiae bacterium]|nr:hypothetical protein [Candidatus Brocadiia bacterium]
MNFPIDWLAFALLALMALEIFDYFILQKQTGQSRFFCLIFAIAGILPYPFFVPESLLYANWIRFFFAMVVFNKIIKSIEIAYYRVKPEHLESFGRYLFWSLNFPEPTWPKTQEDASIAKKQGQIRILRFFLKETLVLGLVCLSTLFPEMHNWIPIKMLWLMLFAYLHFSGLIDIITGVVMQSGIMLEEVFDSPLVSQSPREFWGKRWNIYFRNVSHRNIFLPAQGKMPVVLGVICVFALSIILHEYMIWVSLGVQYLGYMTAFFSIHCAATIAQTWFRQKTGKKKIFPMPVAICLNLSWMILTAPIFMYPMT